MNTWQSTKIIFKLILFYGISGWGFIFFDKKIIAPLTDTANISLFKYIPLLVILPSLKIWTNIAQFLWQGSIHIIFEHYIDKVPFRLMTFVKTFDIYRLCQGICCGMFVIATQIFFLKLMGNYQVLIWDLQGTDLMPAMMVFVCATLLVAISEELMYRGYILKHVMLITSIHMGCIVEAVAYGMIHFFQADLFTAINAMIIGLLLGYSVIVFSTVYWAIGFHWAHTTLATLFLNQRLLSYIDFDTASMALMLGLDVLFFALFMFYYRAYAVSKFDM